MKAKSLSIYFALLVFVMVSAACQTTAPSATKPAATMENNPAPTRVEAGQNSKATTAPQEKPAGGLGAFRMDDFSVGLDTLTSYKQSLTLRFNGTLNDAETHSNTSFRRTIILEPAARLSWLQVDGDPEQMVATIGEVQYQKIGAEGVCSAYPIEEQSGETPLAFQPLALPPVIGANVAGDENINGVAAAHYTFDESAIGRAGEVKAEGNLWVAKEGGYVVKYALSIEGEVGPNVKGVQTWEYELSEANVVSEPGLPADCAMRQVEDFVPLPSEAKDILRMPNFLQFSLAQSPEQTAQFYQDQADALQWEEIPSTPMQDADRILNFKTTGKGLVSIRLHKQEGGTKVTIQTLPNKQ
jgi:hypothetical protein